MQVPSYPFPPRPCSFAPFKSLRVIIDTTVWLRRIFAANYLEFSLAGSLMGAAARAGNRPRDPSEAMPITRCSHPLSLFINALPPRLSHPFPPFPPSSPPSCTFPSPYATRHCFCRLRDSPGCRERRQCPQGVSLRCSRLRRCGKYIAT